MTARAVIGLGSNLDDPVTQIQSAVEELSDLPGCQVLQASSLYRSQPMGPADQPDYINAVALLETTLAPHILLDAMQAIESNHGRDRTGERWGPRTLDLDLLLYNGETISDERLTVPHPGMAGRNFVLYPLAEIMPGIDVPGMGRLADLLAACPDNGLQRLEARS